MMVVTSEITVIESVRISGFATIAFCSNNIAIVTWHERTDEITKEEMILLRESLGEFGKGEKLGVYTITEPFVSISTEAQKFAGTQDANLYTYANAVLVDNLAKKILYNLFLRISKTSTPTRAFTNQEDAINWLIQMKD